MYAETFLIIFILLKLDKIFYCCLINYKFHSNYSIIVLSNCSIISRLVIKLVGKELITITSRERISY